MESFIFGNKVTAKADILINNQTVKNLWHSFTSNGSVIEIQDGMENTFLIGNIDIPNISPEQDYVINVDENGIAINAHNYGGLMRGYTALIRLIDFVCLDDGFESFKIDACNTYKEYKIERRMVHYCVFPETDLETIRKEIRYSGTLHYTHIVLEFWGMLKYDCMKELAWDCAFDKEMVKDLVREIREFGMESIPFINHLGHASMCRSISGKHTILDQNPKLSMYFMEDGWEWNIFSDKTKKLLRNMRSELMEIFGEGEYFHIGCDEAYMFSVDPECHKKMVDYLKELTLEIESEGRKPMLWADMFIAPDELNNLKSVKEPHNDKYYVACESSERANEMLNSLSENSILIDWQYDTRKAPLRSFLVLKEKDHNVMEAPWLNYWNCKAAVDTLNEYGGYGLMATSWQEIGESFISVLMTSIFFGGPRFKWSKYSREHMEAATLLRKLSFEKPDYTKTGFRKYQF